MFREQAKLQRQQREKASRAEALEEKREVDAARKSLAEEAAKNERFKSRSKTEQERLRLEIIAERKLKEERKHAERTAPAVVDELELLVAQAKDHHAQHAHRARHARGPRPVVPRGTRIT